MLVAIVPDAGYLVTMEQTHVLPTVDGIPDQRRADIVFSRAGVQALVDVVVADPMGASMVLSAAHIPRHAPSHAAWLKEEAYVIRHSEDLFYPFAIVGRFTQPWTGSFGPRRRLYPLVSVVTAFLTQWVSIAL
ncbi:unnamed protein product [Calypogeia fissa]